jgi:hypothetical protein
MKEIKINIKTTSFQYLKTLKVIKYITPGTPTPENQDYIILCQETSHNEEIWLLIIDTEDMVKYLRRSMSQPDQQQEYTEFIIDNKFKDAYKLSTLSNYDFKNLKPLYRELLEPLKNNG